MASRYIIGVKNGSLIREPVRQPQAPRKQIAAWLIKTNEAARRAGLRMYLFRFGERWTLMAAGVSTGRFDSAKSWPADNEDAAAMWLLHAETRRGKA